MPAPIDVLAYAWLFYGLALGFLALYGGHLLILVVLTFTVTARSRARAFRLACEIVYGLLNPLVYLILLRPGLLTAEASGWQHLPLQTIAWILLGAVWMARLAGTPLASRRFFDAAWRTILAASLLWVALFGVKDVVLFFTVPPQETRASTIQAAWLFAALAPLYLIPIVLLADYLSAGARGVASTDFLLLSAVPARVVGALGVGTALVSLVLAAWRPSDDAVRRAVLSHRDDISRAAAEYRVDPGAIAAIVYVTNRYQISPFRGSVERLVMAAWLRDAKGDFAVAQALNISIGIAQIKPVTAQTAAQLVAFSGKTEPWNWAKEYREVPRLQWGLAAGQTADISIPWPAGAPKRDVVAALLNDRDNLRACALILALYQLQWDTAGAAQISTRPDILATLFQIGFERSTPKAAPRSNEFGRQVQAAYDSAWLRAAFR